MLFFKIAFHDVGLLLRAAEIRADVGDHLGLMAGATPAQGVALDVLVEKFVRVQLRTVARKKEEVDVTATFLNPALHLLRLVHRMAVGDQEDLSPRMPQQSLQKLLHDVSCEALLEHHEGPLAAIGDRRDHVAAEPRSPNSCGASAVNRLAF